MSLSPAVSVVIPAYNYARFLASAIDSVLSQNYPEFELIVVDDGSTDDTEQVLARYTDPRMRYIRQENAGLSAARNTGIRNARFGYVAFLDADDRWLPGLLSSIMEAFAKLPEDFAMVATGSMRMDAEGRQVATKPSSRISADKEFGARDFILKNPSPLSSSVVIRREIFEVCGCFDTTLRSSEDRDMWIRIAACRRVYFITRPSVLLRRHPHNMSKQADRMKHSMRKVIMKAHHSGTVSHWDAPFWMRVYSLYYFQISWTHFDEGRRAEAIVYLLTSFLFWPLPFPTARLNVPTLFRLRALFHFLFRRRTVA